MSGTATYYERRKMLLLRIGSWTITGRIPTRNHVHFTLRRFGLSKTCPWKQNRLGVWQCNIRTR